MSESPGSRVSDGTSGERTSGERSSSVSRVPAKESSISLQYPMLNKHNYSAWAIKMEVYMEAQGVWDAVVSEEPAETRKDKMALAAIYQGITEATLLQLGPKKTAKDAWNTLRTMYLGAARVKEVKAQSLRWEFDGLRMEDDEAVDDFAAKVSTLVNKIRSLGEGIEEEYIVKKILRSVSPKFVQIASTIEEFGDLKTKTMEELIGSLKAHEERYHKRGANGNDEHLLLTRAEWEARSSKREGGGSDGNGGRSRGNRKFDKAKVRCYNCNDYGHFASECSKKKEERAHLIEADADDEPALL